MFKEAAVVAVALALLWATPAQAKELNRQEVVTCELIGSMAKTVMTYRQYGYSPLEAREKIKAILVKNDKAEFVQLLEEYITDAYDGVRYTTRQFRESAINDFKADKETECMAYFMRDEEPTT
jgi:tRNA A37 threonylcarbamoyladenosine dehydratase